MAVIIQSLKLGKACDKQGFCAEQLKLLPYDAVEVIQKFVQECINTGVIVGSEVWFQNPYSKA